MAKLLKWEDETGANQSSSNQREYLRIEPNIEYRVRPVLYPVKFERFYNRDSDGKLHSAIAGNPEDCPVRNKYGLEPKPRYAMNVIDRADGKLKIMEFPFTVYEALKTWKDNTQREPGGKNGTDFVVKKTGSGIKGTKWSCKCVQGITSTLWTEDDLKLIDKKRGGSVYNLREIYAATPTDKVEERLGLVSASPEVDEEVGDVNVDSVDTVEDDFGEGGVDPDFGDEDGEPDIGF